MHITFECESAFELWNKVKKLERSKAQVKSVHFNTDGETKRPWIVVAKKEDFDAV